MNNLQKRRMGGRIRKAASIAPLLAGALLAPDARADGPSLSSTFGAGYEAKSGQARATGRFDCSLPLPYGKASFAFGQYATISDKESRMGLEEFDAYASLPIYAGLWAFGGAYISKHLWVDTMSPEGGMSLGLGRGFEASASYIRLTGLDEPHLLLAALGKDFLDGDLRLVGKAGWTVDSSGSGRLRLQIKPADGYPMLAADSIAIFDGRKMLFLDTTLNACWEL